LTGATRPVSTSSSPLRRRREIRRSVRSPGLQSQPSEACRTGQYEVTRSLLHGQRSPLMPMSALGNGPERQGRALPHSVSGSVTSACSVRICSTTPEGPPTWPTLPLKLLIVTKPPARKEVDRHRVLMKSRRLQQVDEVRDRGHQA